MHDDHDSTWDALGDAVDERLTFFTREVAREWLEHHRAHMRGMDPEKLEPATASLLSVLGRKERACAPFPTMGIAPAPALEPASFTEWLQPQPAAHLLRDVPAASSGFVQAQCGEHGGVSSNSRHSTRGTNCQSDGVQGRIPPCQIIVRLGLEPAVRQPSLT